MLSLLLSQVTVSLRCSSRASLPSCFDVYVYIFLQLIEYKLIPGIIVVLFSMSVEEEDEDDLDPLSEMSNYNFAMQVRRRLPLSIEAIASYSLSTATPVPRLPLLAPVSCLPSRLSSPSHLVTPRLYTRCSTFSPPLFQPSTLSSLAWHGLANTRYVF